MAEYSKEFSKMKGAAAGQLKDLIAGIKSGEIQMSGNEPKMSLRALRTLLLSEDKVHGALVEDFLSGKLNVEQFKNKLRSAGETKIPKPLRRLPTDRIHHGTPLEIGNIIQEMPDEELRNLLNEFGDEGYFFGDSDPNVRGGSFDERAHTGARPKASASKIVYPNTVGEPGLREVSAHPRGTRDKLFDIEARPTTAKEAKGIIRPLLEQGKKDFQLGVIADTPRRNYINQQLVQKGIIEPGTDIFSATIDDATLKRARPFLQSAELQQGAAEAFKTPTLQGINGGVRLKAIGMGALAGFMTNQEAMTKARSGDALGALQAAGTEMAIGEGVTQIVQLAGPKVASVAQKVAPIAKGFAPAAAVTPVVDAIQKSNPQKSILAAQQRGGKIEVGFGSLRFRLPELGVTEALGGFVDQFMK